MTRSKGDGSRVLIKSRWWYDPNSACPVISLLTKNHYIRCQSGSIFWQGEVASFPFRAPNLCIDCKPKATRRMRSKICSIQHLHPGSRDRGNHSSFVEADCTSEASLNSFSLLIVHNSYSAAEIWMLLCCRNSVRPRHKMRARIKPQVGSEVQGKTYGWALPRTLLERLQRDQFWMLSRSTGRADKLQRPFNWTWGEIFFSLSGFALKRFPLCASKILNEQLCHTKMQKCDVISFSENISKIVQMKLKK